MLCYHHAKCLMYIIALTSCQNPEATTITVTISEQREQRPRGINVRPKVSYQANYHSWYLNHRTPKFTHYARCVEIQI